MNYDFSFVPDRRGTGSYKWLSTEKGKEFEGAFPLSTADMEWGTAPAIREALAKLAFTGIYGYTVGDDAYKKVVCDYMKRRHNWEISPDWIVTNYGVVSALHTCVRAYTKKGEGVIIQPPVYGHFDPAVNLNGRKVVNNNLVIVNGRYEINFEELEKQCKDENNKMLIFCSPHNPVGRVWSREEVERVVDIALKNDIIIISDEIHFDIVSKPHTILASISEKAADITVTCTAPSKTFNIAGLGIANIIISNPALREKFTQRVAKDGYECINCFAYPAVIAAYRDCDDWVDEMNKKLAENWKITKRFFAEKLPQVKLYDLEGTYLVWLDVSCLGIDDDKIAEYFAKNAGIVPNSGGWFGENGKGFIRLNIAIPQIVLLDSLNAIKRLFDGA